MQWLHILRSNIVATVVAIGLSGCLEIGSAAAQTPINVGTYTSDADDVEMFKGAIKHRAGNAKDAPSGKDILTALHVGDGQCIKTWMHGQHAWSAASPYGAGVGGGLGGGQKGSGTGFYAKDAAPQPTGAGDGRAGGGRSLPDLQREINAGTIRFCRPCRIYIYGCRVSTIGDFASQLSTMTGCIVYAGNGSVSTTHDDGTAGKPKDDWRAEEGWDTYSGGTKTSLGQKYIAPTVNW